MNYIKIQQEVLKTNIKAIENKTFGRKWKYGCMDNEIGLIDPLGYYMILIPVDKFYLDLKIFDMTPMKIKPMFDVDTTPAEKTNVFRMSNDGKTTLVEFKISDDVMVYVDAKLLKQFDSCNTFRGSDGHSPIFCYEDDKLCGMVLPFYLR